MDEKVTPPTSPPSSPQSTLPMPPQMSPSPTPKPQNTSTYASSNKANLASKKQQNIAGRKQSMLKEKDRASNKSNSKTNPSTNLTINPTTSSKTTPRTDPATSTTVEVPEKPEVDDLENIYYTCVDNHEGECVNGADGLPGVFMDQLKAAQRCERDTTQRGSRASRGDESPKDDKQGVNGIDLLFKLATRGNDKSRDPNYEMYLQNTLGKVLPALLYRAAQQMPKDGINFIAQGLFKAADNQLYVHKRLDFQLSMQKHKVDYTKKNTMFRKLEGDFKKYRKDYTAALKIERADLKWLLEHENEIPEKFSSPTRTIGRKKNGRPLIPLIGQGSRQSSRKPSGIKSEVNFDLFEDSSRYKAIQEIKRRLLEMDELEKNDLIDRKEIRRDRKRQAFTFDEGMVSTMKERMFYQEIEYVLENCKYTGNRDIEYIKLKIEENRARMNPNLTEKELTKEMIHEVQASAAETEEQIERWEKRLARRRTRRAARAQAKAELENALLRGDFTLTKTGLIVYASENWEHIGLKPPVWTNKLAHPVMEVDSPARWAEKDFKCQVFLDQECYYNCDDPSTMMFPKKAQKGRDSAVFKNNEFLPQKQIKRNPVKAGKTAEKTAEKTIAASPRPEFAQFSSPRASIRSKSRSDQTDHSSGHTDGSSGLHAGQLLGHKKNSLAPSSMTSSRKTRHYLEATVDDKPRHYPRSIVRKLLSRR